MKDLKFIEIEIPDEIDECTNLINNKYNAFAYILWGSKSDPFCADKNELKG